MKLFNLVDSKVVVEPEALLLPPFAAVWDKDKDKYKKNAYKELSYIWFMEDLKSDFFEVIDRKKRHEEVSLALELPKNWKPSKEVKKASEFYRDAPKSLTYQLFKDSRLGLESLSKLLRDPDFTKIDIKKVADTIKSLPMLVESIRKLEDSILKEQEVNSHRGSQDKALFEDGGF